MGGNRAYPLQPLESSAYTRKDCTGDWVYRRDNQRTSQ